MHHYLYKGLKSDGTTVEGICDCNAMQDVYRRMEYFGLRPISVAEHDELSTLASPEVRPEPPDSTIQISA